MSHPYADKPYHVCDGHISADILLPLKPKPLNRQGLQAIIQTDPTSDIIIRDTTRLGRTTAGPLQSQSLITIISNQVNRFRRLVSPGLAAVRSGAPFS